MNIKTPHRPHRTALAAVATRPVPNLLVGFPQTREKFLTNTSEATAPRRMGSRVDTCKPCRWRVYVNTWR